MQEVRRRRAIAVGLRARLPLVTRMLALVIFVAGIVFVIISYYRLRNNEPFRMRGEMPELSKTVTSIVEGYERRVTGGGGLRLLVRAARDIPSPEGHQEWKKAHLKISPPVGDKPDQITAHRAIYLPETSGQT